MIADGERVLFVHAHPDDESIDTGGTIAALIERGAVVTVLTCTRGERGEVIPADLQGALESPQLLAQLRMTELASAMTALGVTDHRYLGNANARWNSLPDRSYLDSGMQWGSADSAEPSATHDPESLTSAEFSDVAADIAAVIVATQPTVVVSYDARGGYGHPDHIRTREAALRAAQVYAVPFYEITADGSVVVDVAAVLDRKRAALAAYRSQLTLDHDSIVLSGGQRRPIATIERYELVVDPADEPVPFSEQRAVVRFFAAVLGGVIGVALGALLTVYNQFTLPIAGAPIWVGAIAGILIAAAVFIGFRLAFGTRIVTAFAALGMIAIVTVLSFETAGGSVLIPQNGQGILWEISPPILAALALAWPQGGSRRPARIEAEQVKGTRV